ncbi:hypothetical protein HCN81_24780, partial [Salmonella enterica subsp. enterica serovar Typhimurium]|uniref:hypothetical protein n=1 Tax=Salmonella enterica TaxID=28901 RepID=UPI0016ACD8CD
LQDPVWEKTIADSLYQPINNIHNYSQSMALTEDRGTIAISTKRTYTSKWSSNTDIYIIKTNSEGEKIWERSLGSSGNDYGVSVITTREKNYLITGEIQTPNDGAVSYIACLTENGDLVWEKQIGRYGSDTITSVKQTSDEGFILT